jgi:hypothetical protein
MRLCVACADALLSQSATIATIFGKPIARQPAVVPIREGIVEENLNGAERRRAEQLLIDIAHSAFKKANNSQPVDWRNRKERERTIKSLESAVVRQCNILIKAAQVKPGAHRSLAAEKKRRAATRKELADELRSSRTKLKLLRRRIDQADQEAAKAVEERARDIRKSWAMRLNSARARLQAIRMAIESESRTWDKTRRSSINDVTNARLYPEVPAPMLAPTRDGLSLPDAPGIYFLWNGSTIEYVGKSIRLCNRVRLGSHHVLMGTHKISFVFVDAKQLTWAECYYIGTLQPQLNYGAMASHYEAADTPEQ